jgi:hypothetical protein
MPERSRRDKQHIDEELLRRLYSECHSRIQRVHEKLTEEEGIEVTYSTLTRMLRNLGISAVRRQRRCGRVPDEPGAEMQHDTTLYRVKLGKEKVRLVASLLYLRYSKRRYLKLYRSFNRFQMKCFFHEALMFWGYAAKQCIIDNTNLARLRGTGKAAVIVPEMESFSKRYGFSFICHEKGHANRKAGEERSFWTVETNFLPGRTFDSLEDINEQAFKWSTQRLENRAQGKAGLIPAKAFEHERQYLTKLPTHLPPPYKTHDRGTDQYGYVAFNANFYFVPGTERDSVKVLQYSDHIKIYQEAQCVAEYPLPPDGVKNRSFPEGQSAAAHKPKNRKKPTTEQQLRLRAMAESVALYLDYILSTKGIQHHNFIRKLDLLSRKMTPELFIKSIERAHKYKITSIEIIGRIASLELIQADGDLPFVDIDQNFYEREAYQEGSITEQPNLLIYDEIPRDDDGNAE